MSVELHPTEPIDDPGQVFTISAGDYAAEIGSRGATLRALRHRGRDLVVPQTPQLPVDCFTGRTLAPWSNRLEDGRYEWDGKEYQVPLNEPAFRNALHGLLCWQDFAIDSLSPAAITLSAPVSHQGYPGPLTVAVTYDLSPAAGLTITITAHNTGQVALPYGVSTHPYLTCNHTPLDSCNLSAPATQVMLTDERLLPAGVVAVDGELDLRTANPIGPRRVDNAYTGLPERWEVRLTSPGEMAVVMTAAAPWLQIYTGDRIDRAGIAVEPMTAPPNSFKTGEGVIRLEPGATHEFALTIRAE